MTGLQKQLNLLGLALRASQLIHGDENVEKALKRRKVYCIVMASDVSEATNARYERLSQEYQVPIRTHFTREQISHAIGKTRSLCAFTNQGFSQRFLSYETGEEAL